MLIKHGLSRTLALSKIGDQWATKLDQNSVKSAITLAQEENCNIMVFVGNKGCIQIFSGEVHRLMQQGPWFNVLDPGFNLHLREDLIAEAWAIKRPSSDGIITSIEAFNAKGDSILTLFGKRKPGNPELAMWQNIVAKVIDLSAKQEATS
jgi:putative hemin transport protein